MFNRLFCISLIIFSSLNSVVAQEIKYDFPGNKHLPQSAFFHGNKMVSRFDGSKIVVSARLIPWSEYLGLKPANLSISPDRMVYEVLVGYCHLTPKRDRLYYFKAIDAETTVPLARGKIQYTKDFILVAPRTSSGKILVARCGPD
jgi:hypothetical protein